MSADSRPAAYESDGAGASSGRLAAGASTRTSDKSLASSLISRRKIERAAPRSSPVTAPVSLSLRFASNFRVISARVRPLR